MVPRAAWGDATGCCVVCLGDGWSCAALGAWALCGHAAGCCVGCLGLCVPALWGAAWGAWALCGHAAGSCVGCLGSACGYAAGCCVWPCSSVCGCVASCHAQVPGWVLQVLVGRCCVLQLHGEVLVGAVVSRHGKQHPLSCYRLQQDWQQLWAHGAAMSHMCWAQKQQPQGLVGGLGGWALVLQPHAGAEQVPCLLQAEEFHSLVQSFLRRLGDSEQSLKYGSIPEEEAAVQQCRDLLQVGASLSWHVPICRGPRRGPITPRHGFRVLRGGGLGSHAPSTMHGDPVPFPSARGLVGAGPGPGALMVHVPPQELLQSLQCQQLELECITSLGEEILSSCHPDSVVTIKSWVTVAKSRFQEVRWVPMSREGHRDAPGKETRERSSSL